jgi:hypothetical protein
MSDSDLEEEERDWSEAAFGPPPWKVYDEDWHADPMDIAVGKFIRELPLFEVLLMLTRDAVAPSENWVDVHLDGPGEALKVLEDRLLRFPSKDHFWLTIHLAQAKRVLDLRQAVVHGTWTLVDRRNGIYRSERPMRPPAARALTGVRKAPDSKHPTRRHEFNAGGVMAGRARARSVSRYLGEHQDDWQEHFAGS